MNFLPWPREASRFDTWLSRSRLSVSTSTTEQHKFAIITCGGLAFRVLSPSLKTWYMHIFLVLKQHSPTITPKHHGQGVCRNAKQATAQLEACRWQQGPHWYQKARSYLQATALPFTLEEQPMLFQMLGVCWHKERRIGFSANTELCFNSQKLTVTSLPGATLSSLKGRSS